MHISKVTDAKQICSDIVDYYDDININSWILCEKHYPSIKFTVIRNIDDTSVELAVTGPRENVIEFIDDLEDGTIEPMESMSRKFEDDDDYETWLNNEIAIAKKN